MCLVVGVIELERGRTLFKSIIRQNNMTDVQFFIFDAKQEMNLQVSRMYGIGFLLPGKYPFTTWECSSNIPRIPWRINAKSSFRCYHQSKFSPCLGIP